MYLVVPDIANSQQCSFKESLEISERCYSAYRMLQTNILGAVMQTKLETLQTDSQPLATFLSLVVREQ